MAREVYRKIIAGIVKAAKLARTVGINNILQPDLVKEMIIVEATERQLDRSRNAISHVGFSERWARENGKVVYQDKEG